VHDMGTKLDCAGVGSFGDSSIPPADGEAARVAVITSPCHELKFEKPMSATLAPTPWR
jgi:hypothetical protein